MDKKYPEIVQFFRDSDDQSKLQMATNEYQKFANTYHRMNEVLNFTHRTLPDGVFTELKEKYLETLKHPKLDQVIG